MGEMIPSLEKPVPLCESPELATLSQEFVAGRRSRGDVRLKERRGGRRTEAETGEPGVTYLSMTTAGVWFAMIAEGAGSTGRPSQTRDGDGEARRWLQVGRVEQASNGWLDSWTLAGTG